MQKNDYSMASNFSLRCAWPFFLAGFLAWQQGRESVQTSTDQRRPLWKRASVVGGEIGGRNCAVGSWQQIVSDHVSTSANCAKTYFCEKYESTPREQLFKWSRGGR